MASAEILDLESLSQLLDRLILHPRLQINISPHPSFTLRSTLLPHKAHWVWLSVLVSKMEFLEAQNPPPRKHSNWGKISPKTSERNAPPLCYTTRRSNCSFLRLLVNCAIKWMDAFSMDHWLLHHHRTNSYIAEMTMQLCLFFFFPSLF